VGFWNKAGRWLAWAAGLLLVIIGFNALWRGLDIIQVERGWASVIAGTTAMTAGVLAILLTVLIDHVDGLRLALLTQGTVRVAEVAPEPPIVDEPEPEPPKPIEIPVEPPPLTVPTSAPGAFNFRTFGKRPGSDRAREAIDPETETVETPPPASPEPATAPELPTEQIRRFAPPQFRRPSMMPPRAETLAPQPAPMAAPEPEPEPEPEPKPEVAQAEPTPAMGEIEVAQVVVSVEASITDAIAEELRLPRASNLDPLPSIEVAEETHAAEVEPPPTPEPPPPPPPPEQVLPQRGVVETHAWLEKALGGEEREPALDWLRQRRPEEERPERQVPSFMRRHVEPEPSVPQGEAAAEAPQTAEPGAAEAETASAPETPSVVGRYAANGSDYTLYADGSIDAQTPDGSRHFASMDELRAFLQRQDAPTEG
jgi:hypothetical protein